MNKIKLKWAAPNLVMISVNNNSLFLDKDDFTRFVQKLADFTNFYHKDFSIGEISFNNNIDNESTNYE